MPMSIAAGSSDCSRTDHLYRALAAVACNGADGEPSRLRAAAIRRRRSSKTQPTGGLSAVGW